MPLRVVSGFRAEILWAAMAAGSIIGCAGVPTSDLFTLSSDGGVGVDGGHASASTSGKSSGHGSTGANGGSGGAGSSRGTTSGTGATGVTGATSATGATGATSATGGTGGTSGGSTGATGATGATSVTVASSSTAPPSTPCGTETCSGGTPICCVAAGTGPVSTSCTATKDACTTGGGHTVSCTSNAECNGGVCCIDFTTGGGGLECEPACGTGQAPVCTTNGTQPCPMGETCHSLGVLGFGYCAHGNGGGMGMGGMGG